MSEGEVLVVAALAEARDRPAAPEPGLRRLFLARRSGGRHAGLWELPGGKVESGEDPRAALLRELREELGIGARVLGSARAFRSEQDGRRFTFLVFPTEFEAEPTRLTAHDRWAYVSAEELGDYELAPLDPEPVAIWAESRDSAGTTGDAGAADHRGG